MAVYLDSLDYIWDFFMKGFYCDALNITIPPGMTEEYTCLEYYLASFVIIII